MNKALKFFAVAFLILGAVGLLVWLYFTDPKASPGLAVLFVLLGVCWSAIGAIYLIEIVSE